VSIRPLALVLLTALVTAAVAVAADSTDPRIEIAKADQALAGSSVLRFTDLGPAWAGGAVKPVSLKIPVCPGNQPDNHDLTITGHAESTLTLESAGLQVDSDVLVFKSPAQVTKLAKRVLQPVSLQTCLRFNLLKQVAGQGVTIVGVSQLPLARASGSARLYRVTLEAKSNGQTVSVFNDFLFVSKGRSQFFVSVVAPSSEKGQLPSLENNIAKTLAARAKA